MGSFSSKKASRVTEQDKAVLQLKQQRDKLKQCQKRIELNLEKDREIARKLLKDGKKERALLLLRKKKFQEGQLGKLDGMLENLERMTFDLEFSQVQIQVLDGLKKGNAALKKLHDVMNIDEIEKIMEETREGVKKQKEIDEIIQGHLTQEDEEDVLTELNEIINASKEVNEIIPELPEVPNDELVVEPPEKVKKKVNKEKVSVAV